MADRPYLHHAFERLVEIAEHTGVAPWAFVPFAVADHDAYSAQVGAALAPLGIDVRPLRLHHDSRAGSNSVTLDEAGVVFVGGGNTFRLLDALWRADLVEPVRERVLSGRLAYVGSSAGTNVACPTIRTTNDMPIVLPPSLDALSLVPFQVNAHYLDADPASTHQGETRAERLAEFLQENDCPVAALREGAWLNVEDGHVRVGGSHGGFVFRRDAPPEPFTTGDDLSALLATTPRFDCATETSAVPSRRAP